MMLSLFDLFACSVPLLLFVQFNPFLAPWQSRKVLHMCTGTLLMLSDASDPLFRFGVYGVTAAVLASVGSTRTFHFAAVRDVGIMSYLTFCSVVAWLGVPFWRMAPLFFADPWGAIVGRTIVTPKLVGDKSVGGTLAVATVLTGLICWGSSSSPPNSFMMSFSSSCKAICLLATSRPTSRRPAL